MAESQKHICGQCQEEFDSEADYVDHACTKRGGAKPSDPTLDDNPIAAAALERGNKRAELEEAGDTPEEAVKKTRDIKGEGIVQ